VAAAGVVAAVTAMPGTCDIAWGDGAFDELIEFEITDPDEPVDDEDDESAADASHEDAPAGLAVGVTAVDDQGDGAGGGTDGHVIQRS